MLDDMRKNTILLVFFMLYKYDLYDLKESAEG
jgi:hypothetical protein